MKTLLAAALLAAPASAMRIAECGELAFVAQTASLIVQGEVASLRSRKDKDGSIHTYALIKVARALKGKAGKFVTIKFAGGTADGVSMAVSEGPAFKRGEKGYFYLDRQGKHYDAVCGWGATAEGPPADALKTEAPKP